MRHPAFPRFKPFFRWHQLEFPHGDRAIKFSGNQGYLRAPGVGWIRLRKGRQIPAFGRVFIVEKNVVRDLRV